MRPIILVTSTSHGRNCNIQNHDSLLIQPSLRSFLSDFVPFYLNRYLRVLPLVMFFCLRRCRLVSFHICKASRRSSKFCQPVADLHLSSFFLPCPPSTTPHSCLSRSSSSFFFPPRLSYRPQVFLVAFACSFLSCLPIYRSPKIGRKGAGKIGGGPPTCRRISLLSPLLQHFLLHLPSFLLFAHDFLRVRATRADSFARDGSPLLRTSNGYLPNYFGVGFLWVPEKSPWARHGNRDAALLASLSRIPNLCGLLVVFSSFPDNFVLCNTTSDAKCHKCPDIDRAFSQ